MKYLCLTVGKIRRGTPDQFSNLYASETRTGNIFYAFVILAIVLACLGLLGLATFTAQQRTKEIGIRKVLGASVLAITSLLSEDFLKPVILAAIIAFPISWWGMNKWLDNFAYKISLSWWIFAITGFSALLIAFVTISFQTIRAALGNPVKALRSE